VGSISNGSAITSLRTLSTASSSARPHTASPSVQPTVLRTPSPWQPRMVPTRSALTPLPPP
jgi:hypothetical protein